jgi:hypothetical protein
MPNSIKKKPTFVLDYFIFDTAIGRHYEVSSKPAKDLLYKLTTLRSQEDLCIAVITPMLQDALHAAFGNRPAFYFLMDNVATIEPPPMIPTGKDQMNHAQSTIILAIWKHLKNPEYTCLVTEDPSIRKSTDAICRILRITPKVIGYKEAYRILEELDLKCLTDRVP